MIVAEVNNLVKTYDKVQAVTDFSFTVEKGELVALVGPDGAGKTSIFRSMCNVIEYDSGDIKLGGYDLRKDFEKIKLLLGYMPQTFSLYADLSVEENLAFYSGLFGLTGKKFKTKKEELYQFSGLGPFAKRRASNLSGGMKQKLALSCNLIHDPEILILDEPTTGVDPLSRRQFWEILKDLKASGSTIIVSTPYMDEVALSDRSIFIFKGSKLAEGTPSELAKHYKGSVYLLDLSPSSEIMTSLNEIDGLTARRFGASIHLYTDARVSVNNFGEKISALGIDPDSIAEAEPELEDTFIQLMGE